MKVGGGLNEDILKLSNGQKFGLAPPLEELLDKRVV